jgi:aryl-alcohol dehydrogenase-like predicted oxidoreductase
MFEFECRRNLALVDALRAVADAKRATVAQVAIGWALSRGEDIVRLVGRGGATGSPRRSGRSGSS